MTLNYTPLPPLPQKKTHIKYGALLLGVLFLFVSLAIGLSLFKDPQETTSQAQVAPVKCPPGQTLMGDANACNQAGGTVSIFIGGGGDIGNGGVCCLIPSPSPSPTPPSCPEGSELIDIDLCPNPVDVPGGSLDQLPPDKICCRPGPSISPSPEPSRSTCDLVKEPEIINVIVKCPECSNVTK